MEIKDLKKLSCGKFFDFKKMSQNEWQNIFLKNNVTKSVAKKEFVKKCHKGKRYEKQQ